MGMDKKDGSNVQTNDKNIKHLQNDSLSCPQTKQKGYSSEVESEDSLNDSFKSANSSGDDSILLSTPPPKAVVAKGFSNKLSSKYDEKSMNKITKNPSPDLTKGLKNENVVKLDVGENIPTSNEHKNLLSLSRSPLRKGDEIIIPKEGIRDVPGHTNHSKGDLSRICTMAENDFNEN